MNNKNKIKKEEKQLNIQDVIMNLNNAEIYAQKRVCELVGSIYFYGGFKAETKNEKELAELLSKLGYMYKNEDELIAKQQLQIEDYKQMLEENSEIIKSLMAKFYSIGAPLNDNILQFNKEQQKWCFEVVGLLEKLNGL